MKRLCFLAVLVIISIATHAQIIKNTIFLGVGGYYYSSNEGHDSYNYTYKGGDYGLSAGKAFRENSIAGISFHYRPIKVKDYTAGYDTVDITQDWYAPGIFLREYRKIAKDFYFFAEVGADVMIAKLNEEHSDSWQNLKADQLGGSISLTPGISYQAFKRMQIELTIPNALILQYIVNSYDFEDPQKTDVKRQMLILNATAPLSANLSGGSSILGGLGIGFRFML